MSSKSMLVRAAGLATVLAIGTAVVTPATAQGGVNLTPWAGVYIPTRNDISTLDEDVFERDVSVIGGARLTFWGTGRLGFEVTGGYAPAKISGETINETDTNLLAANARLLFALVPPTSGVGVYIGGGGALLSRGNDPFDDDASRTDLGATVGLGFRFGSGENSRVGLRLDIEDYMYDGDFGGGDEFQNDIVTSLGLEIALGGRVDDE